MKNDISMGEERKEVAGSRLYIGLEIKEKLFFVENQVWFKLYIFLCSLYCV